MNVAYLCLGGNIGDRESYLNGATERIGKEAGRVISRSSFYETEAWGVSGQQPYLNSCIGLKTDLDPESLLHVLLEIERDLGRRREPGAGYEPRTIDIDILLYGQTIMERNGLIIPHPRMELRRFVLVPLCEIAADYLHPVLNKTIFNLLDTCQDQSAVTLYEKH